MIGNRTSFFFFLTIEASLRFRAINGTRHATLRNPHFNVVDGTHMFENVQVRARSTLKWGRTG